jgi:hypothetical protein
LGYLPSQIEMYKGILVSLKEVSNGNKNYLITSLENLYLGTYENSACTVFSIEN